MKSINLMKNVGRFTPPPRSHQVQFTPNRLYDLPEIVCTIYPPPKLPSAAVLCMNL